MIPRRGFEDFREFVNPLIALRAELTGEPVRALRVQDSRLITADGHRIEDFHGTQAFGHRNAAVTAAVRSFLDSDSPSWFPSRVNPYAGSLARRLCERTGYSNAFFASSGSEGVEAGIKLGRAATRRPRVLSLRGAYHGCTMGSCGLMTDSVYRELFGPHLPGLSALPFGDADALAAALADEDVAAVVVEPIQVEGGVRPLPDAYVDALCELTARHGTLLVADEVQTGMGRTGRFLASEAWPRRPDAVVLGKHLGGGLMPISALLTGRELFERAYGRNFETSEAHNSTFSGNAAACVAAMAALELLTDEVLVGVRDRGVEFRGALDEALRGNPLFAQTRGEGLVVGVALVDADHPWLSFEHFGMADLSGHASVGLLLAHRLYKRGYFCFVCGHDWSVLRLQPRFDIETSTLVDFAAALAQELEYLCDLT